MITQHKLIRISLALLIVAFVFAGSMAARATTLYTENFSNSSSYVTFTTYSTNAGYSSNPWTVYEDNYNQDLSNNAAYYTGTGTDSVGVFAKVDKQGTYGFAAIYSIDATTDTFNVFRTGLSIVNPGTLTWDTQKGVASGTATLQLMVQVGGSWYVSASSYTPTTYGNSSAFSTNALQASFDFTTQTSWYTYTLSQTGSMVSNLGSLVTLDVSQQTVTGLGWYETIASGQTLFVDTMSISSVPEPASCALLGFAGLSWMLVGRRRRK